MACKTEHDPSENGKPSHSKKSDGDGSFTRSDFFRDLKKAHRKQKRSSQRD
jgi:hypothetical protein